MLLPLTLLMNWRLALVLIVLVVISRRHRRGDQPHRGRPAARSSATFRPRGTAQDALANVMVVQSFARLAAEARLFGEIAREVIRHQFPVLNWWAVVNVLTRASPTIAVISIVVIGTLLHLRGQAEVGRDRQLHGFRHSADRPAGIGRSFVASLFFRMPSLEEFFAVMDARGSVPEKPGAAQLAVPQGEVTFEDVSFAYPGGPPILTDVSFTARPGMSVALVGQTGAGKSTTMALLQRLWDPTSGRVRIDGQDLRDVTLESLRARDRRGVSGKHAVQPHDRRQSAHRHVPARPTRSWSAPAGWRTRMSSSLRQPHGYQTMIGERGTTLSGGQRQRLAIARALLKDPPILILDEATSALDAATEARVGRALRALMAGRTTFIIAHRLSTVRDADEILVFEAGRIVERGSFDALLERNGVFAELVSTQLATAPAPGKRAIAAQAAA